MELPGKRTNGQPPSLADCSYQCNFLIELATPAFSGEDTNDVTSRARRNQTLTLLE